MISVQPVCSEACTQHCPELRPIDSVDIHSDFGADSIKLQDDQLLF